MKNKFNLSAGKHFKNFVFGFQDGLISTYVLLAGIAILVRLNPVLLVITLLAEIASGAISMTFGAYISTKTENEYLQNSSSSSNMEDFSKDLSKEEKLRFNQFLEDNPGIKAKFRSFSLFYNEPLEDPISNGIRMGLAFILGGIIPLAPYFVPIPIWSFILASIFSFSSLFIIGIMRSIIAESQKSWLKFSLEMVGLGVIAVFIIGIYLYFISLSYGLLLWA
jgi:VIT1/CCC1 family predicted Fe2+/Mn2+ transporter